MGHPPSTVSLIASGEVARPTRMRGDGAAVSKPSLVLATGLATRLGEADPAWTFSRTSYRESVRGDRPHRRIARAARLGGSVEGVHHTERMADKRHPAEPEQHTRSIAGGSKVREGAQMISTTGLPEGYTPPVASLDPPPQDASSESSPESSP